MGRDNLGMAGKKNQSILGGADFFQHICRIWVKDMGNDFPRLDLLAYFTTMEQDAAIGIADGQEIFLLDFLGGNALRQGSILQEAVTGQKAQDAFIRLLGAFPRR